jgi:filamentous hemagglutinin family protein
MNSNRYQIIFSTRLNALVVVGENCTRSGKSVCERSSRAHFVLNAELVRRFVGVLTLGISLVTSAFADPLANVLPTNGVVVQGAATISQSTNVMVINQDTSKAIVNWQSFDIGSAARVNVIQPSNTSVLLNRVVSNNPSQIFGSLDANGQVILINPNGILFGKDGSVNANAFTASTLDMRDADFMAGNYRYFSTGVNGEIVNQGGINTQNYIALLGAKVTNDGNINTHGGNVYLGSAEAITVPVSSSGRIKMEVSPASINAVVENTQNGVIVSEGGQVYIQASTLNDAVASIVSAGKIDTSGKQAGVVNLLADAGIIKVSGSITANSTDFANSGGSIIIGRDSITDKLSKSTDVSGATLIANNGFVETSGDYLKTDGISVKAKDWLLDPTDINIVATGTATPDTPSTSGGGTTTYQETAGINTSEVLKSTIESAINGGTSVTITTANPTAGANGAGNITLGTALSFSNTGATDATLTLLARNGITQNAGASITTNSVTSTKLVNVVMTSEGLYGGAAGASASSAGIRLNSTINTNGDVTLSGTTNNSGAASNSNAIGVDTAAAAAITARNISIIGSSQSSFGIQSASALTASVNITLDGTSKNWVGVATTGAVNASGALSITGTKTSAAGYQGANIASNLTGNSIAINGTGMNWDAIQLNNGVILNATTTLNITGNSNSAKGIYFVGTNTFNAASYSIKGTTDTNYGIHFGGTATFNSTSTLVESLIEGTKTTAGGDTVWISSGTTLNLNSGAGKTVMATSATNVGGGIRLGFAGGSVVNTTGDVTIGSKNSANAYFMQQGTINALSGKLTLKAQAAGDAFYMQDGGGIASRVVGTNGANITIDGTSTGSGSGVNLNASTSTVNIISTGGVSGSGLAGSISITGTSATGPGIYKNAATITNTNGAITLNGTSSGGTGIGINSGTGAISSSADLIIEGVSTGGYGVYSTGTLTSTIASVSVTGTSSTSSALSLQGDITANQIVTLSGTNTAAGNANATVYINRAVTATNGTIAVTANTSGTTASATQLASGAALNTTNRAITLSTDSLSIDTTVGAGANINAGTNTVTLENRSSGVLVSVGGNDVGNATVTSRTLGLTNAELNRVTAGNLLIGSNTAGNITVSSATTTNATTGDIALQTAGNIAINTALTIGDAGATKTVTLNASGANSAITQTAAIKSAGLELLGTNASYTLTSTGNDIKKLAGNTKLVNLTNNSAFAVDTVNTVGLTTSGNTTFNSTATVTENQKLDTAGLELLGVGGSYTLTNTGNNVRKIAGNTGSVNLTNNSTFAVDTVNTVGLTTSGNTTFRSTAAVTQTQKVAAAGLELLGIGGTYTLTNTSNSISTLAANTGTLSFVNSANFTVGTVNSSGITTTAGDVTLASNNGITVAANITSNGNDIAITANGNGSSSKGFEQSAGTINAGAGDVTIVGTTKTATGWPNRIGANVRGTITGNNISITGTSDTVDAIDGMGVQFQGASSVSATGTLTVAGEVKGGGTGRAVVIGNGNFPNTPTLLSGATGIDITGTLSSANVGSADNAGVFIEASGVTATSSSGAINITGDSTAAGAAFSKNAVFLKYAINLSAQTGTTIQGTSAGTGASVNLDPEANINVTTGAITIKTGGNDTSNAFIMSGANALITQNSNAGVLVRTSGTGNVTAPKINNNGTGNVVVAAGSAIAAGTGTGGQVLTVSGNTITNNLGKTYLYSGSASSTGDLGKLNTSFETLYYEGTSNTINTAFSSSYNTTITNGANMQVLFREAAAPAFTLTLPSAQVSKIYGQTDPALASLRTAVQTAYTAGGGAATVTTDVVAAGGGSNTFGLAAAEAIAALTGTRAAGENVNSGTPYVYSLSAPSLNTTVAGIAPVLVIEKANLTLSGTRVYDAGTTFAGQFLSAIGVAGESFSVTGAGATGNLSTKNVQTAQALSSVTGLTLGNSANGGLSDNYNPITTTGSSVNVTPAQLNINVADSRMFVTQTPSASTVVNQGVTYSGTYTTGFAPTDTVASALSSDPSLSLQTYGSVTNASQPNPYVNTLGLVTTPTANYGNYVITVNKGTLIVDPAGMLIITIPSLSSPVAYGTTTATNIGLLIDSSTITAKYFTASNGGYISTLTVTPSNSVAGQYTAVDSTGASVNFLVNVTQPSFSTSQHLKVGNYVLGTYPITTPSNANFTSSGVNGGTLTINQAQLNVSGIRASDKVYDGTTNATISTANALYSGLVSGDIVTLASTGAFSDKDVGVNKTVALSNLYGGSDLSNYYFGTQTQTSTFANIAAISSNEHINPHVTPFINPVSPKAPVSPSQNGGSLSKISSQQTVAEVLKPQEVAKKCSVENPEVCDCQNTLLAEVTLCVLPLDNSDTEQVADDASLKVSKQ